MEERGKGQDNGETEREGGRECECRTGRNTAPVVKQTEENKHVSMKCGCQHLVTGSD